MKVISIADMRRLEQISGAPGVELMHRAGREAARLIKEEFSRYPGCRRIVIVTGRGNNAGDGVVAALALAEDPALPPPVIAAVCPLEKLSGEAGMVAPLVQNTRVRVTDRLNIGPGDFIVDALFGIGLSRKITEPYASWIREINDSGCPVAALDLPSGLNGDTGEIDGVCIRADVTITFGLPKTGLFRGDGPALSGRIKTADLQIEPEIIQTIPAAMEAFFEADARPLLTRLPFDAYKNTRGRLLLAAGSVRYPGAAQLAVRGALRSGAGFLRLATSVAGNYPPPVVVHRDSPEELSGIFPLVDAVAAGPGWGMGEDRKTCLSLLAHAGKPMVLDADGLNLLAQMPDLRLPPGSIITPHVGEARRLMPDLPEERIPAARMLAEKFQCVAVLKGPQTVVAAPDGRYCINTSGSPALGIAGAGDVLTGICGAWLAAGMASYDAARLGVWLHGAAGECVPMRGLQADELPERVREVMGKVSPIC